MSVTALLTWARDKRLMRGTSTIGLSAQHVEMPMEIDDPSIFTPPPLQEKSRELSVQRPQHPIKASSSNNAGTAGLADANSQQQPQHRRVRACKSDKITYIFVFILSRKKHIEEQRRSNRQIRYACFRFIATLS